MKNMKKKERKRAKKAAARAMREATLGNPLCSSSGSNHQHRTSQAGLAAKPARISTAETLHDHIEEFLQETESLPAKCNELHIGLLKDELKVSEAKIVAKIEEITDELNVDKVL